MPTAFLHTPKRTAQVQRGLYIMVMTWLTRAMLLCLLLGGATHALAQKEHWSKLMRAEGNESHQSLDAIRAAYQAQHGSDSRLQAPA